MMNSFNVTRRFKVTPHKDGKHCGDDCHPPIEMSCGGPLLCIVFLEAIKVDEDDPLLNTIRCQACLDSEKSARELQAWLKFCV